MTYILSKVIGFFIRPFNVIVILAVLSFVIRGKIWRKRLRWVAVGVFVFFSMPFIYDVFILMWEVPAVPIHEINGTYEVAVVLGGTADVEREPRDRLFFQHGGAERITHAVNLYKAGKVKKILFTGGNPRLFEDPKRDNRPIYDFYLMCGVAPEDIIMESASRNTHENALFVKRLLEQKGLEGRVILLTSAYHMRRAVACYRKVGLEVTGFSTDFYSPKPQDRWRFESFVPSPMIMDYWGRLIKEWVGYLAYRMLGYI